MIKNLKSIILASLAIIAGAMTSCTDKMDNWDTDSTYARLFGALSLSVTPESTTATVEYKGYSGADKYQIQYSTTELTDEIEPYAEGTSTIEVESKEKAELTGLTGETNYYLRIRAIGEGKNPSKWVYYSTSSGQKYFTTKGEQIMNPVEDADRTENAIRVTWQPESEVTHLLVQQIGDEEGANDKTIELDSEAAVKGEYTVTGLKGSTGYIISIYNNEAKRGSVTTSTAAEAPKGDYEYTLKMDEDVTSDLIKAIAEEAKAAAGSETSYSATIRIPQGSTMNIVGAAEDGSASSLKIPEGMSVVFFGEGGLGANVRLTKSINLVGSHNTVKFQNLNITDAGCQYIINQSAAANVAELVFDGCYIYDLDRSVVRTQAANIIINKITVSNCILYNVSKGDGYSVIQIGDAGDQVDEINVINTTVDTQLRSFIEISKLTVPKVNIANCTFYNFIQNARYFIDANGQNTNITLTNNILGKTYTETSRGVRTTGTITITGCVRASDCIFASNDIKELPAGDKPSSDYFTDPNSHDFTLKIDDKVGDPRWYKK